jgi:hypothetical protein
MGPRFLTARVAGICGILFFVGVAVPGFATGGPPDPSDPAAKWLAYYTDHHSGLVATPLFAMFGTFFAFFFFAKLISTLREAEPAPRPLTMVAIISVSVTAAMAAVGGILAAAAAFRLGTSEHVDAVTLLALNDASAITLTLLGVPVAAFFAAEGVLIRSSGRLPAWLGVVYLVAALLELVGPFSLLSTTGAFSPNGIAGLFFGLLPLAVVIISTSIVMLARPLSFDEPDSETPAAGAAAPAGAG